MIKLLVLLTSFTALGVTTVKPLYMNSSGYNQQTYPLRDFIGANGFNFQATSSSYITGTAGSGIGFYTVFSPSASMVVSSSGNVGIGNENPASKLDVSGQISMTQLRFPDGTTMSTASSGGGGNFVLKTGDTMTGTLSINTSSAILATGTISTTTSLASSGLTTTGSIVISGVSVDITAGPNQNVSIVPNGTGNVGIGTTAPGQKLAISGAISVDGIIYANGAISGTTLTTTGAITASGGVVASNTGAIAVLGSGVYGTYGLGTSIGALGSNNSPVGWAVYASQQNPVGYGLYSDGGINFFAGNTGVGLLSPTAPLSVSGTIMSTGQVSATSGVFGGNVRIINMGSLAISTSTPNAGVAIDARGPVSISTTQNAHTLNISGSLNISAGGGSNLGNIYMPDDSRIIANGRAAFRFRAGINQLIIGESSTYSIISTLSSGSERFRIGTFGGMSFGSTNIAATFPNNITYLFGGNASNSAPGSIGVSTTKTALYLSESGTTRSSGNGTLVGGTLVVTNTLVSDNTNIFLTAQNNGGVPGALSVSARTSGTSFTVLSTSAADTSKFSYFFIEPFNN